MRLSKSKVVNIFFIGLIIIAGLVPEIMGNDENDQTNEMNSSLSQISPNSFHKELQSSSETSSEFERDPNEVILLNNEVIGETGDVCDCTTLSSEGWHYNETSGRWCITFPDVYVNASLIWSTDIIDAYVAYFSYETEYVFGTYASGYVEISADGGNTWYILDILTGNSSPITREFDISYWAGHAIKIRMRALSGQQNMYSSGHWCVWNLSIYGMRDRIPPVSTVVLTGDLTESYWYSSPVQVVINAYDPEGIGIDEIHYILDGTHTIIENDVTSFTVYDNGDHQLEYWAVDVAENEETHHMTSFRIDTIPPTVSIVEPTHGVYLFGNKIFDAQKIIIVGSFQILVDAEDDDSGIYRIQFYLNERLITEDVEEPFKATCALKSTGTAILKVITEDKAGHTQDQSLKIIYFKLI